MPTRERWDDKVTTTYRAFNAQGEDRGLVRLTAGKRKEWEAKGFTFKRSKGTYL